MAGIFLEAGQTGYNVVNNGDVVFGSTGTETVTLGSSTTNIEVDANAEQVNFAGAITDYKFAQAGNVLKVYKTDGTTVVAEVVTDGSSLVSFNSGSAVALAISSGVMSIDGNPITTSIATLTIAVEATEINSANVATEDFVDYSSATVISGLANDIVTMLTEKGTSGNKIGLADDVALILTDTSVSSSDLDSIVQGTTGAVTATITSAGVTATLGAITHVDTNDVITFATNDTTAVDASDLVDLKALVDTYTEGTTINALTEAYDTTDLTTEITNALAIATGTTETVAITGGAISIADANTINAATTGVVTAGIAKSTQADLLNASTGLTGNGSDTVNAYTITTSDTTAATAVGLTALDALTSVAVVATDATVISGSTAEFTTFIGSLGDTPTITIDADEAFTINDDAYNASTNDVTIAATALSAISDKTSGDVTVSNAVKIAGTAAEVETALVDAANSGASLVKAGTALVTISDAADATALKAADLVAIDAKTTGTVTITNAVALTGSAADLNTVLVTNATTTVDAGTEAVTISDVADSAILAATIKAIDDATTGTLSITSSIEIDGTAGSDTTADTIDVSGITFTSDAVTIDGKDGADIITGGTEVDTLKGGDDNDTFIFDATSSATVLVNPDSESNDNDGVSTAKDSIVDFASGDLIQITGELADGFDVSTDVLVGTGTGTDGEADTGNEAKDYKATTYLVARDGDATNGFDTGIDVTSNGTDAAFADNAAAQAATVFNVILAADTSTTGVTLGAGADTVVAGATASKVTLGAGNDTFTGGAGADTIVFADTAVHNGKDTINAFTTGDDKLDISAFISSIAGSDFVAYDDTANTSVATGSIINVTSTAQISASDLSAKFAADDDDDSASVKDKMEIDDSSSTIVVVQDDDATSGTDYDAQVFYMTSNSDGTTIAAVLVGTIHTDGDSSSLAFGDFQ